MYSLPTTNNIEILSDEKRALSRKKKALFIINPISGTGKQRHVETYIKQHLSQELFEYEIEYTIGPGHATTLARKAAKSGLDLVVGVGGDGSINEIAKGLIGTKTTLGIVPMGSGNGLAGHLNIPLQTISAIACINHYQTRLIDTVQINNQNFLNIAGIGFDAKVSLEFSNYGRRGLLSYLKIVLMHLPQYKPKEYLMMIDGRMFKEKAFLICFANSGQYGNNVYIAPSAKIDDGFLDLLIVRDFPPHATPRLVFDLISRTIESSKYIHVIKCKHVKIMDDQVQMHIDGEPLEMRGTIDVNVIPRSLNVVYNIV